MEQVNSIQLSVQLLGCILIARGAEMEQKQRKKTFLGFVNIIFQPLCWRFIHQCLRLLQVLERPE